MAAPLVLNIALIGALAILLQQSDKEQAFESRYRHLTANSGNLFRLGYEAPLTLYMGIQCQEPMFFKIYEQDVEVLRTEGMKNINDWKQDPLLSARTESAKKHLQTLVDTLDSLAETRKTGVFELLRTLPKTAKDMQEVKDGVLATLAGFQEIGYERTRKSAEQQEYMRAAQIAILIFGAIMNGVLGFLLFRFYQKGIRSRLNTIHANTELLSKGLAMNPPLDGEDEIAQLDAAFQQMAKELREASEKEQALFNNASDVICVLNEKSDFVKINPACFNLWGLAPEQLIGVSLFTLIQEQDAGNTQAQINSAKEQRVPFQFESRTRTIEGKALDTLWSVYWSNSSKSMYCVVHDMTERKHAERIKKQFLSMITSDLKIPLASIATAIHTLVTNLAGTISETAKEKLSVAQKNVQRLLTLVNDLLQLTQLDSGKLELHKKPCSVQDLLVRAAQDVEGIASKQNVAVSLNCNAGVWTVDEDRIMQVMVNLLSNAIKFSPPDSTVVLEAMVENEMVELRVVDKGRGVPAAHRELIFEKFKQVEAADGKRKAGTGLGLPICKQIVEEHGGTIGVNSVEGEGSTFWFRVPVFDRPPMTQNVPVAQLMRNSNTGALARIRGPQTTLPATKRSKARLNLAWKGGVLIGAPTLFGLVFVGAVSMLLFESSQERARELHERRIVAASNNLLQEYLKLGGAMSGAKTPENWQTFIKGVRNARKIRDELATLVEDDPAARAHYDKFAKSFKEPERFYQRAESIMADGDMSSQHINDAMGAGYKLIPATLVMVRKLQSLLKDAQVKEFVQPAIQQEIRAKQAMVLAGGLGTNIVLSILLALYFSRDITSRLRVLALNAQRLADEEELYAPLGGEDEIAELDETFHTTARALQESRLKERAVFDNSQDVIFALDGKGCFTSLNPACNTMWLYSQKELIGTNILNLLEPEERTPIEEELLTKVSIRSGRFETRIVRKDNVTMWVMWSYSKSGENGQIYCVANDITKRKELEQLKQEFLAVVSHDLRTPLTSITGIAKLINAGAFGKIEQAPAEVLRAITRNSDKLLELINDILDIEKLEAGHMNLILEDVRVKDLLEKSVNTACGANAAERVTIVSPFNFEIKVDKDRLIQALSNIVNHAVGFSRADMPVTIDVRNAENCLEIKVTDTGRTLMDDERAQLFARFRDTIHTDSIRPGTGLALPIARKIVESHGGSVSVHPSIAGGNDFLIRLPFEPVSGAVTPVAQQA
ncbi:MAG: PAS domain S-box protein [Candidatus Obscuribacterales bacterium]|nr:PAS domain S-box protein [Candidatus Obscuribacterales bacterium]